METEPRPRRLSDILKSIDTSADLTFGTLVDTFGERAFGTLMFIFAVPNIVPTPPGTSAVLGLPLVILTFQLMIGRQALWLPEAVRRRAISGAMLGGFVKRAVPGMMRMEKILRPRLTILVASDVSERVMGVVALMLALILFLPIPGLNILPAASIALLALGLAERDGVAALIGYAGAAACGLILFLLSATLVTAVKALLAYFSG